MEDISEDDFLLPANKAPQSKSVADAFTPKYDTSSPDDIGEDDFFAVPKKQMPGQMFAVGTGAARNIVSSLVGLGTGALGGLGGAAVGGPAAPATAFAGAMTAGAAGAYGAAEAQNALVPPGLREQLAALQYPGTYSWSGLIPGFATGKIINPKALLTKAGAIEFGTEVGSEFAIDAAMNAMTGQEQNFSQSASQALAEGVLQGRQTGLGRAISQAPVNLGTYLLNRPNAPAVQVTPEAQAQIMAEAQSQAPVEQPVVPPAPVQPAPVAPVQPAPQAAVPVQPAPQPVAAQPAPAVPAPVPVAQPNPRTDAEIIPPQSPQVAPVQPAPVAATPAPQAQATPTPVQPQNPTPVVAQPAPAQDTWSPRADKPNEFRNAEGTGVITQEGDTFRVAQLRNNAPETVGYAKTLDEAKQLFDRQLANRGTPQDTGNNQTPRNTPAPKETPVAPQAEAPADVQPAVPPAAQAPQGQEAATPATPRPQTKAPRVEPTPDEPAEVTLARRRIDNPKTNPSRYTQSVRVLDQFENDQKLAKYDRTVDLDKVSDEALTDFLEAHSARVDYDSNEGIDTPQADNDYADAVSKYAERRFGPENDAYGDLLADMRNLAKRGVALPVLPKWFNAESGRTFSDIVRSKIPFALKQPALLKADEKRAKTDGEFRNEIKLQAEGMVEDYAQALADLGWTQVDPSNNNAWDAVQDLVSRATSGERLVPQGGVLGVKAKSNNPRGYTPKKVVGQPAGQPDVDSEDPFSRRDRVEENQQEFFIPQQDELNLTPAKAAKATKQAQQIAANPSTPATPNTPAVDSVHRIDLPGGKFAAVVDHAEAGSLRSGLDTVQTPADVAHVTGEWFAQRPQEVFAVVVADKNGKILAITRITQGTHTAAMVPQGLVTGAALGTPGAAKVWGVHNHPSGKFDLSPADMSVNAGTTNILKKSGIEYGGLFAIAKDKYSHVDPKGAVTSGADIPQLARTKTLPITERVFTKNEALGQRLTDQSQAVTFAKNAFGNKTGVILLSNNLTPVGMIEMSPDKMAKLRQKGGLDTLLPAIERSNAVNMISYLGDGVDQATRKAVGENLAKLASATGNLNHIDMVGDSQSYAGEIPSFPGNDFKSVRDDATTKTKSQLVSEANRVFADVDPNSTAEAYGTPLSEYELESNLLEDATEAKDAILDVANQVEATAPEVAQRLRDIVNPPQRNAARDARKAGELDRRVKTNAENRAGDNPARRGIQGIIDRAVFEARKNGQISDKEIEGLTRILNMVGSQFFDGVKLSIRNGEDGQQGQYESVARIVTIFREAVENGRFEDTAAHEVAHHLSRFLPEADRKALRDEWLDARRKFLKQNPGFAKLVGDETADWTKVRIKGSDLQAMTAQHPDLAANRYFTQIPQSGKGEPMYRVRALDETYRLFNPSEWFAETFKDVVRKRLNSDPVYTQNPNTWKEKLTQLWEAIKTQFRQMFGKDQAARILSNFAKGRYEAEMVGSADISQPARMSQRDDYRGFHHAPTGEYGEGSLDAMDRTYPEDLYSPNGARFYGDASPNDREMHRIIVAMRGKPDAEVTVYRAVPKGSGTAINKGDWVTPLRAYAEGHGERFAEGMDILERKVKASELFTEGNSMYEFGWSPKETALDALPKDKPIADSDNAGEVLQMIRDESARDNPDADLIPAPKKGQSAQRTAWDIASGRYFSGLSSKAHQNAERNAGSPTAKRVANIIHARPGTKSDAFERDMPTAIATKRTEYQNRFNAAMAPLRGMLAGFKDTDSGSAKEQRETVYRALTDMITGRKPITGGELGRAAQSLKDLLADLHAYRTEAGDALGNVKDYYPAVYDSRRISESREAFVKDATRAYAIELDKLSDADLAKEAGVLPDDLQTPLPGFPGFDRKTLIDGIAKAKAEALHHNHLFGGEGDFGSIFGEATRAGAENPSDSRVFGKEAQTIMAKWQVADPFHVVTRYIGNSVKRSEIVRRFGADGKKWGEMRKAMLAEGVPTETVEEMRQLVRLAAGVGIPPRGRTAQGVLDTVTLMTAASAMGRGFLNNLVEPVSMGIRTGNPGTMLRAYAETWGRFLREVPALSPAIKERIGDTFWQKYGEHIGTIHNSIEDAWMTNHSMDIDADQANPAMRWITNRVYKANLMDASENAKQQASHAIGYAFIKDLAKWSKGEHWMNKTFGVDPKQSVSDQLNELGVPPEKHAEFADWVADLDKAKGDDLMAKMTENSEMARLHREAMTRFSYQSSVRSSRAHRPVFQDDLFGKTLLQLMNFSYSYAAEVNSRVYDMAKQGVTASPEGKDYNAADRVRLLGPAAGAIFAIAAYRGLLELKDLLYPTESTEKRAKDPAALKWANAASYAGVFGPKIEQAMKYIKRDQVPGGPAGQVVRNVGRAATSALDAIAEGDDFSSAKKQAVKAAIPVIKGGIVAGASAANPVLGAAAVQATNTTGWANKLSDAADDKKAGKGGGGYAPKSYDK